MKKELRRLRIGYVMQADSVQMDEVSGPQLHVKAVVEGFQRLGHEVRTVAIQQDRIQWSDDLIHWEPATFGFSNSRPFRTVESVLRGAQSRLRLPFLRLFDSYRFSDACVAALTGYDILYERCGILSYGGLVSARRLGIPLILELNGDLLQEYVDLGITLSKAQWRIINLATRLMYRRADRLVPVTETLRQSMISRWHLDAAKVIAVANGADVERFICPDGPADHVRRRYGIGPGAVVILVCSFEPWHGVDLLLQAFARLRALKPEVNLVLVGDGRLRGEMEKLADELGVRQRVTFTGKVSQPEVASLLGIADVAVTYHRGSDADTALSPLKLFEYMAAGKAIVAPASPNIARLLTHRVTGLLLPPGKPATLADAILELLENDLLRASLGQAAREQAIEKHAWSRTVSELEAILFGVLEERR